MFLTIFIVGVEADVLLHGGIIAVAVMVRRPAESEAVKKKGVINFHVIFLVSRQNLMS